MEKVCGCPANLVLGASSGETCLCPEAPKVLRKNRHHRVKKKGEKADKNIKVYERNMIHAVALGRQQEVCKQASGIIPWEELLTNPKASPKPQLLNPHLAPLCGGHFVYVPECDRESRWYSTLFQKSGPQHVGEGNHKLELWHQLLKNKRASQRV